MENEHFLILNRFKEETGKTKFGNFPPPPLTKKKDNFIRERPVACILQAKTCSSTLLPAAPSPLRYRAFPGMACQQSVLHRQALRQSKALIIT